MKEDPLKVSPMFFREVKNKAVYIDLFGKHRSFSSEKSSVLHFSIPVFRSPDNGGNRVFLYGYRSYDVDPYLFFKSFGGLEEYLSEKFVLDPRPEDSFPEDFEPYENEVIDPAFMALLEGLHPVCNESVKFEDTDSGVEVFEGVAKPSLNAEKSIFVKEGTKGYMSSSKFYVVSQLNYNTGYFSEVSMSSPPAFSLFTDFMSAYRFFETLKIS